MRKIVSMRKIVWTFLFVLASAVPACAGQFYYEVFYINPGNRNPDSAKAEAQTGEAVAMLRSSNPALDIRYASVRPDANGTLASLGLGQADVVVAEVLDGRIVRHKALGNVLPLANSRARQINHVMDGVVNFFNENPTAMYQNAQNSTGRGPAPAGPPSSKKIAVYISESPSSGRYGELITDTISQYFPRLVQSKRVSVRRLSRKNPESAKWLDYFKAAPGQVVIALEDGDDVAGFTNIAGPANPGQDQNFASSLATAVQHAMNQGGL